MKLHLITIGKPKLSFAQAGLSEYLSRLKHYHDVRVSHIPDKFNDAQHILEAMGSSYKVGLVIQGTPFSSQQLADFLDKRTNEGREVCFVIGGPNGLPTEVITACNYQWSFSRLTFPHDLAMVVLAEALYRASTINAGQPYHR